MSCNRHGSNSKEQFSKTKYKYGSCHVRPTIHKTPQTLYVMNDVEIVLNTLKYTSSGYPNFKLAMRPEWLQVPCSKSPLMKTEFNKGHHYILYDNDSSQFYKSFFFAGRVVQWQNGYSENYCLVFCTEEDRFLRHAAVFPNCSHHALPRITEDEGGLMQSYPH